MEQRKNDFFEKIPNELEKFFPIGYTAASSFSVSSDAEETKKPKTVHSKPHNNKEMICFKFYKPISKIL